MQGEVNKQKHSQAVDNIGFNEFYHNTMQLLKRIEGIDPQRVIENLINYLAILSIENSDEVLPVLTEHRSRPYSWLHQAELISTLSKYVTEIKDYKQANELVDFEVAMLEESIGQLEYFIDTVVGDRFNELNELFNAIVTCLGVDQLQEYRDEIKQFLSEKQFDTSKLTSENIEASALRLLQTGMLAYFKQQYDHVKRFIVQSGFMLDRLGRFTKDFNANTALQAAEYPKIKAHIASLNTQQHFDAFENKFRSQADPDYSQVQQQFLQLTVFGNIANEVIANLKTLNDEMNRVISEKVAQRYANNIQKLDIAAFQEKLIPANIAPLQTLNEWLDTYNKVLDDFDEQHDALQVLAEKQKLALARKRIDDLEAALDGAMPLLKTAEKKLGFAKLKLSCAAAIKECYGKFSLAAIFKAIAEDLNSTFAKLNETSSALNANVDWNSIDISPEHKARLLQKRESITHQVSSRLNEVEQYLSTIDFSHNNYPEKNLAGWQGMLTQQLKKASAVTLEHYHEQLIRIRKIENKYIRALFIIYFTQIEGKLTETVLSNIQSWRLRNVNEPTIVNTFKYLGITISDEALLKVAPHLAHYRELYNKRMQSFSVKLHNAFKGLLGYLHITKKA